MRFQYRLSTLLIFMTVACVVSFLCVRFWPERAYYKDNPREIDGIIVWGNGITHDDVTRICTAIANSTDDIDKRVSQIVQASRNVVQVTTGLIETGEWYIIQLKQTKSDWHIETSTKVSRIP